MPRHANYVHPILSAVVLVSAVAITGVLFLMYQAISVAEDLTSAVNTLNERLGDRE